ncbi:MAG TPA: AarF/UbiB family protein, partial [Acidimicrobiia bacterium]|nr:AarF/UbiB family protein [Acidimicrobiia bacterium]
KYLDSDREFAQFRPSRLVADFAQMMHDAIDLSQELNNLHRFIANFDAEKDVVFPTPYPELSSRRVLTMSFISGCALTERSSIEATGWEVDTVLHRAADIYLEMIFRDSFFHADPHPGNLRLPDGTHVAILDFGDVGHVSSLRRRQLEDLVIAMGTHDVDGLVDVIVDMTTPPPSVDMNQLRSAIEGWLDRSMVLGAGQIDMIGFIETGMTVLRENRLILPADLALLFRVVLGLEGLGREVDTEIRVNELMAEYVRPLLASRLDPRSLVRSFGRAAHAWEALIGSLPREIERVVHEMRAGQLGIDFRVRDTDGAVDHLIDGLIASASLLASAELMSRRSGPTVGSLSIPGVVAAGVGALTWRRLVRRRDLHQTLISRARKVAALGTARNFA